MALWCIQIPKFNLLRMMILIVLKPVYLINYSKNKTLY